MDQSALNAFQVFGRKLDKKGREMLRLLKNKVKNSHVGMKGVLLEGNISIVPLLMGFVALEKENWLLFYNWKSIITG